ncbi:BTB/POZ domain-containing protein At3g05675 isoform X2 [Physcomitrium patens]|uniref:BTB/POZ domain-containing protein At3g05675 isoform X2 n=1 Tax=Physcomitrium patens TaxID=3218 RepID=UPI000D1771CC|nr:BTB/POZ domain-containing protein At3g05675-like isoform X2 [Physcomitrium patens]|eukprot:XP_024363446.1 BTB/POZ domain-containing protein At3g05675-like isoform X2 [Physcomitrella patens]
MATVSVGAYESNINQASLPEILADSLRCTLQHTSNPLPMAKGEITEVEPPSNVFSYSCKLGERATSDVIVRLRTVHGRDDWFYSHSEILCAKSKYFAVRLSDDWPTYHLLDSRNCVEVICIESDIDHHVNLLRMLYSNLEEPVGDMWHSVKNALGMLKVATKLGCDAIASKCALYLEAVPWEESEEEEILKALPAIMSSTHKLVAGLGAKVEPILARLQPVDTASIRNVFLSAVHMATLSESGSNNLEKLPSDLKVAAQEQVEYMLEEDDDAPLLIADDNLKAELKKHFLKLYGEFKDGLSALVTNSIPENLEVAEKAILEKISDLVWAWRMLPQVGLISDFVELWVEASSDVTLALNSDKLRDAFWNTKLHVVEITATVLKAVGYGNVILTANKRTQLVKVWLPFICETKPILDTLFAGEKIAMEMDMDLCQSIENALVSLVLSLPSVDQAEILADWLRWDHARFPDLSEAFEVWCFRTKAAKRRLSIETPKSANAISSGGNLQGGSLKYS